MTKSFMSVLVVLWAISVFGQTIRANLHIIPFVCPVGSNPISVFASGGGGEGNFDSIEETQQQSVPHILSTPPSQNELNVSVFTSISVTFDVDMDETTINDSAFVVNERSTGLHLGTIDYHSQTRTATFDPSSDFDQGEVVTVVLTTHIQSSDGTTLDSSYIWPFTIMADNGPGTFVPDSVYPVSSHPEAVFAAHLDGDCDLDLVTTNGDPDNASVLLNSFFTGDYNTDGMIDLGDVLYLTAYLYNNGPAPLQAGNADCSGGIDLLL